MRADGNLWGSYLTGQSGRVQSPTLEFPRYLFSSSDYLNPIMLQFTLALLGAMSLVNGSPTDLDERASSGCTEFKFPVTASATNLKITVPPNLSDPQVLEDFLVASGEALAGGALGNAGDTQQQNGTYTMSGIYCTPLKTVASRANTIQYLQVRLLRRLLLYTDPHSSMQSP